MDLDKFNMLERNVRIGTILILFMYFVTYLVAPLCVTYLMKGSAKEFQIVEKEEHGEPSDIYQYIIEESVLFENKMFKINMRKLEEVKYTFIVTIILNIICTVPSLIVSFLSSDDDIKSSLKYLVSIGSIIEIMVGIGGYGDFIHFLEENGTTLFDYISIINKYI